MLTKLRKRYKIEMGTKVISDSDSKNFKIYTMITQTIYLV